MWADPSTWTILSVTTLFVGGVLLKTALWPQRTGDTPHCRGCDYNLTGLTLERCPECGRVLDETNKVRGERHRSVPGIIAGGFLVCISMLITLVTVSHIDLYPHCPTRLLMLGLDDAQRGGGAWNELERRTRAKILSKGHIERIAAKCLERTDGSNWTQASQRMLDWLGQVYMAGQLNNTQAAQFEGQCAALTLHVRPKVPKGLPLPYRVQYESHCPARMSVRFRVITSVLEGTGRKESGMGTEFTAPAGMNSLLAPIDSPGMHHLKVTADVQLAGPGGKVYVRRKQDFTADLQVTAELKDCVKPVRDPKLEEQLRRRIQVTSVQLLKSVGSPSSACATVTAAPPLPVDLAFQVLARIEGKEYPLSEACFHRTSDVQAETSGLWNHAYAGPFVDRMDIILRGSHEVAASNISQEEFWDGELVYKDVPVTCR